MNDAVPPPADLTDCDREPIHEIGAVQPAGFLVALSPDWIVKRVSVNAADHLGQSVDALLGTPFRSVVCAEAVHIIRNRLSLLRGADAVERAFAVQLQDGGRFYDVAVYLVGQTIVLEAEPSEPPGELDVGTAMRSMLARMQNQTGIAELAREAARLVQALTGFDRVMVYRFLHDESGEVIAERARPGLEPYLGLRYPASDIPRQARALLVRNPVRVLIDIAALPAAIVPALDAAGLTLDMSMSTLRAPSSIHVEYLRNMGVRATMTLSIVRDGRLWGLISCHHMTPRHVGYERRTVAELFANIVSLLFDRCERAEIASYVERSGDLHRKLLAAMAGKGAADSIAELSDLLMALIPCDGIAVCFDGKVTLQGETPAGGEFGALRAFLDGMSVSHIGVSPSGAGQIGTSMVYATDEIGKAYPPGREFSERAAGMLAIPISRFPRDYLVFFRQEAARAVVWAGDPRKAAEPGPQGGRLMPRKSFEAWREITRGTSAPWTDAELRAAEALRTALLDIVMQLIGASEAERRAAMQTQELLIAELNHRVRNILGLIRGLITQSRSSAPDLESFAAVLGERVFALARAHDQITAKNWGPGSLTTLIATEAGAYLGATANRVTISGTDVLLQPQAFSTMALVIHELMTNAAKYGALSNQTGRVTIGWSVETDGRLAVRWGEEGGPPVAAPIRRGFGSTIIERSIPHELGGEASMLLDPAGLRARLVLPSKYIILTNSEAAPSIVFTVPQMRARLAGAGLLVEDNMIIALDSEEMLLSLGAARVTIANSVTAALRILEIEAPDFALLDVNLGAETSFRVATRLRELGVPHVFATGYGDGIAYPEEHRGTPTISKPYTAEAIAQALAGLVRA